jgi:hypothetical protein
VTDTGSNCLLPVGPLSEFVRPRAATGDVFVKNELREFEARSIANIMALMLAYLFLLHGPALALLLIGGHGLHVVLLPS